VWRTPLRAFSRLAGLNLKVNHTHGHRPRTEAWHTRVLPCGTASPLESAQGCDGLSVKVYRLSVGWASSWGPFLAFEVLKFCSSLQPAVIALRPTPAQTSTTTDASRWHIVTPWIENHRLVFWAPTILYLQEFMFTPAPQNSDALQNTPVRPDQRYSLLSVSDPYDLRFEPSLLPNWLLTVREVLTYFWRIIGGRNRDELAL